MANEITATASLKATKNSFTISGSASKLYDMSANALLQAPQSIATNATAISLGAISGAPKKLLIVNLDSTNFVQVDSADTFDKFPQKLIAGDCVLLSPQTGTIYGKADTSAVLIGVYAVSA